MVYHEKYCELRPTGDTRLYGIKRNKLWATSDTRLNGYRNERALSYSANAHPKDDRR
jgi:hypothetical protein